MSERVGWGGGEMVPIFIRQSRTKITTFQKQIRRMIHEKNYTVSFLSGA